MKRKILGMFVCILLISLVVTVVITAEDIPADNIYPMTNSTDITNHDIHQFKNDLLSSGSIVAWGDNFYGQCDVPSPNKGFIAISAGWMHSLGLKANGSIVAWGDNENGQCTVPSPNSDFIAVAAGSAHSLGLKADGSIVAWGDNFYGQCDVLSPNKGFIAISAGWMHSLGLKANGSIVAWGDNFYGQCDAPSPNSGFTAIAAGYKHNLGLKMDGSIVGWGYNFHHQCEAPSPNSGFIAISTASTYSLGLKANGSIVAWGTDSKGQQLNNSKGQPTVPSPNSGFTALSAGRWYCLSLRPEVTPNNPPVFGDSSPVNGSTNNPPVFSWSIPINDLEGDTLSWTIQCSNGQTNSAADATNGTKSLSLSGLAYSTSYIVWVNATDPGGSEIYTHRWYTFTTDELDQQQSQMKSNFALYATRWGGQSFIPIVNTLTRVEVYMRKAGGPSSDVVLSIRSALTTADLVNISKPASQIPTTSSWVEFDFSDVLITPGNTYYLVLKTSGGNSKNCYYWGYDFFTPYTNGMRWDSIISGRIWRQCLLYDFCFKTHGLV